MTEQLELVQQVPKLTDRQQRALDLLVAGGQEGLTGEQLGDQLGTHPLYAKKAGHEVARALKRKGLVIERRGKRYVAVDLPTHDSLPRGMTDEIPY